MIDIIINVAVFFGGVIVGWYGRHYTPLAEKIYDENYKNKIEKVNK